MEVYIDAIISKDFKKAYNLFTDKTKQNISYNEVYEKNWRNWNTKSIKSYSVDDIDIFYEGLLKYARLNVYEKNSQNQIKKEAYILFFDNNNWKMTRTIELNDKYYDTNDDELKLKYINLILSINPFDSNRESLLKDKKKLSLQLKKEIPLTWNNIDKFIGEKVFTAGVEVVINNVITSKNQDKLFSYTKKNEGYTDENNEYDLIGFEISVNNLNIDSKVGIYYDSFSLSDNDGNVSQCKGDNFDERIVNHTINSNSKTDKLKIYFPLKKKNKPCLFKKLFENYYRGKSI